MEYSWTAGAGDGESYANHTKYYIKDYKITIIINQIKENMFKDVENEVDYFSSVLLILIT